MSASESESAALLACRGHVPACTHTDSEVACAACIRWRRDHGLVFCADLDHCDGPGCMDHLAPVCVCVRCGPPWRDKVPEPDREDNRLAWVAWQSWMAVCAACGSKRCAGVMDHRLPCLSDESPQAEASGKAGDDRG